MWFKPRETLSKDFLVYEIEDLAREKACLLEKVAKLEASMGNILSLLEERGGDYCRLRELINEQVPHELRKKISEN